MENIKQTGIWIDGSKAMIITFTKGQAGHVTIIESDIENKVHHTNEGDKGSFMGSRHINNESTFEERKKHEADRFFEEIIDVIARVDEIFVFGPGETKKMLENKMDSEKNKFTGQLMAVETSDYITINEIVEKTKKFYKL